ncbi:carbohydrate binding domain-containing protein [Demequina sp. NBRC 110053]|uniref:beta-xylosidase family glycoside hydrolase n=1 Tax=Demequina sp. NBRC 110053 TaxID=1570342 RepID=UPI000A051EF4|nr:carbohydrate binding domain-containing protein [Demequina sp. NBRC 110053]
MSWNVAAPRRRSALAVIGAVALASIALPSPHAEAAVDDPEDVIVNGTFEDGIAGWTGDGNAESTIAAVDTPVHGGTGAVGVTDRAATGAGPSQDLSGLLDQGRSYDISAWVRFDEGPATKQFNATVRYGSATWDDFASVVATRGEWAQITGTLEVGATANVADVTLFFETPWTSSPDPVNDLMDFFVDDVSLIGQPFTPPTPEAGPAIRGLTSTARDDGTFENSILKADVPDVSTIMVPKEDTGAEHDAYYMVSTTMHLSPGAPIMKSIDLVNWEIVNYTYDILSTGDTDSLRGGTSAYGEGQWATSLRYHDGKYYVFFNTNNNGHAYLFITNDIESGEWERIEYDRTFHDPSLFWDPTDDDKPYVLHGYNGLTITELTEDLTRAAPGGVNATLINQSMYEETLGSGFEGAHAYYIDGTYYVVMITWIQGRRQTQLFRSDDLLGPIDGGDPYEYEVVLDSNGIAQGGLIDVRHEGGEVDSYAMLFRDNYPLGRIPTLVPVEWPEPGSDAWPQFGDENGDVDLPGDLEIPVDLTPAQQHRENLRQIVTSDDFANDAPARAFNDEAHEGYEEEWANNGSELALEWQWNHAPHNEHWSLTDREGWLRIENFDVVTGQAQFRKNPIAANRLTYFEETRNTLSQRTFGPRSSAETRLDISGLNEGDVAGLAVYTREFGYVAVQDNGDTRTVGVVHRTRTGGAYEDDVSAVENFEPGTTADLPADATDVYLKADVDYTGPGRMAFYYSLDNETWTLLGDGYSMPNDSYQGHFMGYRFGLFTYATLNEGGHADFDYYYLSDTLTAGSDELDTSRAEELLDEVAGLSAQAYTQATWSAVEDAAEWLAEAVDGASTQNQIDAPEHELEVALVSLRPAPSVSFVDVTPDSTEFFEEIMWLAGRGITKGWETPAGMEFRPESEITRDAMAAFLYRYAGEPEVDTSGESPFVDVTPDSTEFYEEIVWLSEQDITLGWDTPRGQEFRPTAPITRDAMAAFLYRLAGEPDWDAPEESPFVDITDSNTEFYTEITWLADTGITQGYDSPRGLEFRPFNETTRDAMAAFLYRYEAAAA